ncbi:MAG TPA: hypothetical protein VMW84_00005, partial [Acidobacteriota bacterium]|nr:hypothetical protein [Acidobacteriota bacterium]
KQIVMDERVSYSEVAWYPPLFHTIVAMLQIFAGTLDVMVAAFILKLLIATLNALILLSIYLLSRKLFGTGVAVTSVVFTILSVPLLEIIFWGGYANFLGLAYIAFIFYILNKDFGVSVKTFLLFLGTFTIVLSHQLATFVFVLMFVPAFLVSTIGSKKKFIVFFAVIVGGGLAMLAWYARILIEYADVVIEHLFFAMEENVYHISAVTFDALNKNFGASLFLALAGIPLTFILVMKKKALKSSILIIFWLAVPFLLSQLFLLGIYLPYHRFIYFFAMPITILSGVTVYSITKLLVYIESKLIPKITKNPKILNTAKIFTIVLLIFSLLFIQASVFLQRIETYPQFYERASIASYNSGIWVKQHSVPDGTVIVPRSPGSWFYIFSDHYTMEETDPLYSRNAVAEAVLYSFYEMENSRTLTREYDLESSSSGQSIYVSVYNIWTKSLNIPNNQVKVIYVNSVGEWVTIPLSETVENIYWTQNSTDKAQLVSEYIHELFTLEKAVTFSSDSSVINVEWKIEAHKNLANAKLAVSNYMEPSLDYKEALVPGVLNWQNPWDNATYVNAFEEWSVVEGSFDILDENLVAVLDEQNGVLAAFEFDDLPDWFTLGALDNRFIDALKLRYELGDLAEGENREISFSILVYAFQFDDIERWTETALKQQFESKTNLPVQERDFRTYIEEYNIKFVAVDTQKVLSNIEASPALDRVYDNGRATVYTTKR